MTHPVERLWDQLHRTVDPLLPPHLAAVVQRVPEPQFFPCASGILPYENWDDVIPCSTGDRETLPSAPRSPVLVVLNFPASVEDFSVIADPDRTPEDLSHYETTWKRLRSLLEGLTAPNELFVTNAYPMLLRDGGRQGRLKVSGELESACQELLHDTILLLGPRAVLGCGTEARDMVATVADIEGWRNAPYTRLDADGRSVATGALGETTLRCAALCHPSARPVSRSRRRVDVDGEELTGLFAERAMVAAVLADSPSG